MALNFFKKEYGKEKDKYNSQNLKSDGVDKKVVLKVMEQTGYTEHLKRDLGRGAILPGKRISKTGKIYWETRQNRSDQPGKSI